MTDQTETLDTFLDLEAAQDLRAGKGYVVIHPLNDAPEAKCDLDHLGPIKLSPVCRMALVAVRCYLVAIMLMGGYRVLTLIRR
ncbi:MAG: hypothetical protein P4L36_08570 [Holophaga sp.]|nr:hypothetical protein [Holophaga sp.]